MVRHLWLSAVSGVVLAGTAPRLLAQAPEAHLTLAMTENILTAPEGGAPAAAPLPAPPTPILIPVQHTVRVTNNGPSAATGALLTVIPHPWRAAVDWTCVASAGSWCPPFSSVWVPIFPAPMNLLDGGTATFRVTVWFYEGAVPIPVVNRAEIAAPFGVVDPNPYDNTRTLWTFAADNPMPPPMKFYTVRPCRLLDTRASGSPLHAGETRHVQVDDRCDVPPGAAAVAANVTAVNPTDSGNLRFYRTGRPPELASAINFAPGHTRANNAIVKLSYGQTGLYADMMPRSTGATHVVLDVYGYFWNPSAPPPPLKPGPP